jgi:hypothetical protein
MKPNWMPLTMLLVAVLVACASPPSTAPPASLAEPAPTVAPEIVATRPEDIAGVWLLKQWRGYGGLVIFPARLTFRQDGTFSFDEKDEPMHIFGGSLRFADGQVTMDSDECYDEIKALFYHCTMTFAVYSVLQDGKPVSIRMVPASGRGVFIDNVKNKTLLLDEP